MKIPTLTLLPALLLASSASAYLNEGWKPGQPSTKFIGKLAKDQAALAEDPLVVVSPTKGAPSKKPKKKQSYKEIGMGLLEMLNLSMYTATGIDVKKAVTKAQSNLEFQPEEDARDGTIRLTDANWEELVELEDLEEGEERVWALIVHGPKSDPMTTVFYNAHGQAANISKELVANGSETLDLSHVRWGRLDYLNTTEIMTRWIIFKPPYLVFVSNRGKDLRFLAPREVRPDPLLLREVLASGEWVEAPVWKSNFAPAGKYGPYLAKFAVGYRIWTEKTAKIPRFAWLAMSGVISQSILAWLHRKTGPAKGDAAAAPKPKPLPPINPIAPAASDKAIAVAEAVRRRAAAAAKVEAEKLAAQEEEAKRVVEESAKSKKGKGRK